MRVNKYDVDEKNTKFSFKNYARGLKYLKKYKWRLLGLFIIDTIVMLAHLLITKQIQYILDNAVGTSNYSVVINAIIFMICLVAIHIGFDLIEKRKMIKINQAIVIDIKVTFGRSNADIVPFQKASGDCKASSRHRRSKTLIKLHVFGRAGEASGFPGRPGVQGAEPLAASLKQASNRAECLPVS